MRGGHGVGRGQEGAVEGERHGEAGQDAEDEGTGERGEQEPTEVLERGEPRAAPAAGHRPPDHRGLGGVGEPEAGGRERRAPAVAGSPAPLEHHHAGDDDGGAPPVGAGGEQEGDRRVLRPATRRPPTTRAGRTALRWPRARRRRSARAVAATTHLRRKPNEVFTGLAGPGRRRAGPGGHGWCRRSSGREGMAHSCAAGRPSGGGNRDDRGHRRVPPRSSLSFRLPGCGVGRRSAREGDGMDPREDFEAFARARWLPLLRTATLLTGDVHAAEDLVQETLAGRRSGGRWSRQLGRRRPTSGASSTPGRSMPGGGGDTSPTPLRSPSGSAQRRPTRPAATDARLALATALARLTPRQRAVLVLRFYEDRTEGRRPRRSAARSTR